MTVSEAKAPDDNLVIDIRDLSKRFAGEAGEVVALDGIHARMHKHTVTGLIGPDASGKTTLMRIVAGLMLPDAGSVAVLGEDVVSEPASVQTGLSYMPQRFGLYEDLTVRENLDLYADLHGLPEADRSERYDELLSMTGLERFVGRLSGKLSGGMKQKLGVACALVRAPELLLLDEPTVGVDPVSRQELWEIIKRFTTEKGTSVLISTSYLDEAERCDEAIILHAGRLLGQAPPVEFNHRVDGRVFMVKSARFSRRSLERQLRRLPAVMDAVLEGDGVRVLTFDRSGSAALPESIADTNGVQAVLPRFEDAFIDLVAEGRQVIPITETTQPDPVESSASGQVVIEVRDARRMFGDFCAVDDVNFTVHRGEIFGLLGANGAGKTTTFRMLCGLLPASSGTLQVAGYDLRRAATDARSRIGYMAQKFSLYRELTVAQNLNFISQAYGLGGQHRLKRIDWVIESFDLKRYLPVSAGLLPLGYQQRLALAAALMHEPDILFLDEPTSGVDPIARREFWTRVNGLAENGVTVLVTTHFMEEAEYCDRLAIMADGRILSEGSPSELKTAQTAPGAMQPSLEQAFIRLIQANRESVSE